MGRKINVEEQLAQILNPRDPRDPYASRMSHKLIARSGVLLVKGWRNIAHLLGVDERTLHKARQDDPVVERLIRKPRGRVFLDLKAMSELDWTYLTTTIT